MGSTLDVQGVWWLPEHEDHKVPGWFTWDPDSGGELRLQGELRPVVWKDNVLQDGTVQKYREPRARAESEYPVIHGQVEMQAYTLLGCFSASVREFSFEDSVERVHVNAVLEGACFMGDDLRADRAIFGIRHLTGWVGLTALSSEYPKLDKGTDDRFAVLTAASLSALTVPHDGGSMRLVQSLGLTGDGIHFLGVEQQWSLRFVVPTVRLLSWFIDAASDFQDLVTIAVGQTADFEKVNLARAVGRLAGPDLEKATATTLQRRIFTVPGRLVHSGRRRHLRLPATWPWAHAIEHALTTIQAIPLRC